MKPNQFMIEGLDFLGKSSLISDIQNTLGYHQVIHFEKPKKLDAYAGDLYQYQRASFENLLHALRAPFFNVICDRAHLGEAVYADLYRGYSGDYVFNLEHFFRLQDLRGLRLILLTEDFSISNHFKDDGQSFDPSKRIEEQQRFISAFEKSIIRDKQIICVTDPKTGGFRDRKDVLQEALQD